MAPRVGAMLGQSPMDAPVAHTALADLRGLLISKLSSRCRCASHSLCNLPRASYSWRFSIFRLAAPVLDSSLTSLMIQSTLAIPEEHSLLAWDESEVAEGAVERTMAVPQDW